MASGKRGSDGGTLAPRRTAGMREVREGNGSRRKRPATLEDLYGGGDSGNLLHGDFAADPKVLAWFQRRHARSRQLIDDDGVYRTRDGEHEWKVPYGLRIALGQPLIYNQIAVKYPFSVVWFKDGKRYRKFVGSIIAGIDLIARRVQYTDPHATVVTRVVGYHVPPKLRGKFPLKRGKHTYYWCPHCMTARRFHRAVPLTETFVMRKEWNDTKAIYEFMDRKVALLKCRVCGCTNKDPKFRSSNQPYEVRRIKKGARRIKRQKRRK